jgi:hypothetical protein
MATKYIAVHLNAGNDNSGTPRRGWKVWNRADGEYVGFIDEGYDGYMSFRSLIPGLRSSAIVWEYVQFLMGTETTVREYNRLCAGV